MQNSMQVLQKYLKRYWKLSASVLILAAINQVFSLLEPIIFQRIIDNYALRFNEISRIEFFHGTIFLLAVFIGNALISRIAKNFQDYFLNTVSQRTDADMYREGIQHSLDLPYSVFEDERSGETLGKLQKARQDTEKLVVDTINVVFISVIILAFILVFDEATSSLDSLTEEEITKTMRDVTGSKEHLTVLVAHRLSTIMHADRIYVLEKGVIAEMGSHTELLSQKGLYSAMWRQQI